MTSRNDTATTNIFVGFESALSGLYDGRIKARDLHGAIFCFGRENRPAYLDDDNFDRVMSRHILSERDWWKEARAVLVYHDLRSAILAGEKDGRVAWKQADDLAGWDILRVLLERHGLPALRRPERGMNIFFQTYGAKQVAEAVVEQDLPYRVFGYVQE